LITEKNVKFQQLKQAARGINMAYHRSINRAQEMVSFIVQQLDTQLDSVALHVMGPAENVSFPVRRYAHRLI